MKIDGITKTFEDKVVFRDFSLEIRDGSRTVILGPSGRGKSTLFSMMLGLSNPDSGTITGGGKLSALFQEDRLLENMSVMNNLLLVSDDKDRIRELLNALDLGAEERNRVRNLSGGMKRRVSLIRALLTSYDTLLLDEPFGPLDRDMKNVAADLILKEIGGRTLVVITHQEEDAALLAADEVVRL